jgi:hypothetical protein
MTRLPHPQKESSSSSSSKRTNASNGTQSAPNAMAWTPPWLSEQLRAPAPSTDLGLALIYRNTVWRGWIDNMTAQYPSVSGVLGDEWARAAAREYLLVHPPSSPVMLDVGEHYPAFLTHFEPARPWPWLADVAQCDWLWSRAHVAADQVALGTDAWLNALSRPETSVLHVHASCHWHFSRAAPIAQLWGIGRERRADAEPLWQPEGLLVTRPTSEVMSCAIDAPEYAFLESIADGNTLAQALQAMLDACAQDGQHATNTDETGIGIDFAAFSAKLMRLGVFSAGEHTTSVGST